MHSRGTVSALALGTQKVPNLPGVVTVARGRAVSQPGQNPYRVAYTRHIYVHSCVSWRGVRPSVPSARLCAHTHRRSRNVSCLATDMEGGCSLIS